MRIFPLSSFDEAIGIGLGFNLEDASFALKPNADNSPDNEAEVVVKGKQQPDWTFSLLASIPDYVVTVARGNPADAVDSYRATLPAGNGMATDVLRQGITVSWVVDTG